MILAEAPKTHIVYSYDANEKIYFCGAIKEDGLDVNIDWQWTTDREKAVIMYCPDVWNLLVITRGYWPKIRVEVERIRNFE